jgi:hypothetical protein
MNTRKNGYWILGAAWLATAIATLLTAVPSVMSVATFCWVLAALGSVGTIVVASMRAAGPTRSIAHVLYDTEQQRGAGH